LAMLRKAGARSAGDPEIGKQSWRVMP